MWFIGWVSPYNCERPVKDPSVWNESFTWIVPRMRIARGWNLEGWRAGCRPWEVGGRWTHQKSTQKDSMRWKNLFFSRRWTNQNTRRRSGTENIHLDTTATNSRRQLRRFSWRIRRVSSTTSRLTSGCRWSHSWFLVHVRKLHIPPSRRTQRSNFTRRERNHYLLHWSTLTCPELFLRIWMSSKRNASMIIRESMGLETCLIPGQVSHNLLYWKKNLQKDIRGPGRD